MNMITNDIYIYDHENVIVSNANMNMTFCKRNTDVMIIEANIAMVGIGGGEKLQI